MVGIVFIVPINEIHSILKVTFDFSSSAIHFSYGLQDVRIWKDNCGRVFCVRTCAVGLEHTGVCVCVCIHSYIHKVKMLVTQSCLTLCDSMDCSPPGSSVPGILQARILEWVAMFSSRGSSRPRDQTHVSDVSCIGKGVLNHLCHL